MKMTYVEIVTRHAILMDAGGIKKLPRKIHHAIARNLVKFEKELELYNKQKKDILDNYAAKNDDGGYVLTRKNEYTFASDEDKKLCFKELNELNDIEVEVDVFMVDGEEFDKCDSEQYESITPIQEAAMNWMIDYK